MDPSSDVGYVAPGHSMPDDHAPLEDEEHHSPSRGLRVRLVGSFWGSAATWWATGKFLSQTEVHVFALSVSASVMLSFYPFLIVMVSLCRDVLRWPAAVDAIYFGLKDFFPANVGDFIVRNLAVNVGQRGPIQWVPILLLLVTANGVFEPLEVALNRVWGVEKNRSYFKNQLLSLGLIFLCGGLALGSFLLTAENQEFLRGLFLLAARLPYWMTWGIFKMAAIPMSMLALFLMYWLLPNRRVPAAPCARAAFFVGILLELLKDAYLLVWPWLKVKLEKEYGPFYISVSIILLAFLASMIVLAGAERSARDEE